MPRLLLLLILFPASILLSRSAIVIDGRFDDWRDLPVLITDPSNDEHDTDWYGDGLPNPVPRNYSDVDILEVKFTHDRDNLYGYVRARGEVGRTSRAADGHKAGRYYYIITIDVDDDDSTGYAIEEGGYWPNSTGYDMNMEVEFFDGSYNTGHYIHHDFLNESELEAGEADLENYVIRLGPGTYDNYLQWVVFPDSSFVHVEDRGPMLQGIITVAVSEDGREAEMKAPYWGFFWDPSGEPIVALGRTLDISFSLEGSGELSEGAVAAGYDGTRSLWASDTADPIEDYILTDLWTGVEPDPKRTEPPFPGPPRLDRASADIPPPVCSLRQNYPNPFNPSTSIEYAVPEPAHVLLAIYNIRGQRIATLVDGNVGAGNHIAMWSGEDDLGRPAAAGLYICRMRTGNFHQSIRVLLLR